MLVHAPTLPQLEAISRTLDLAEPFVWGQVEAGGLVGLLTGWIHDGVTEVEHVILLPACRRRFGMLMRMAREATAACHACGLDVVLKIAKDDPRRRGLAATAVRHGYAWYAEDAEVDWYVSYHPRIAWTFSNGFEARAHARAHLVAG